MFWNRIQVGDRERALVARNGRLLGIFGPGVHRVARAPFTEVEIELARLDAIAYLGDWTSHLARAATPLRDQHFVLVETGDTEIALVYADGRLHEVLPPARRRLYWKDAAAISAEIVRVIDAPEAPAAALPALERLGREAPITLAHVEENHAGLLYLRGRFARLLAPGRYAFWNAAQPRVALVDLRSQIIELLGQEILTRDKVTLRVNVAAEYRVADPVAAATRAADVHAALYRALQLAVRRTLGRRTLEQILDEKTDLAPEAAAAVRSAMAALGLEVADIALKDIILPGEMRAILNEVVAAEKQAQANLIRRREETAATRSLLNTARLMEDNPLLVRLKELETLERIIGKVDRVAVSDGFSGLLTNLVTLR